ncbi:M24 family metallopeptidase [Limosilactobacillus sp.]|uniref:M24 family metallopeptidase n=1 Tax=Limosilactobacillus sp. TaxID=2773925 RepID=UPI00345E6585
MTRLERLRKRFAKLYIDAMLVTKEENIYYLTGFDLLQGDGALLVTADYAIIISDARYQTALADFDSDEVIATISSDYFGAVNKLCQGFNIDVLGFEDSLSYAEYDQLDDVMEADIVPQSDLVEKQRAVKDSGEVAKLRRAAELQTAGYDYILNHIKVGMTERQVANQLDFWMKDHGAQKASFDTIVASGPNSAEPHATATNRQLKDGDMVTLDFGYFVDGYTADMTRTFAMGRPDPQLSEIYDVVNTARREVIKAARPGMCGDQLDAVGRSLIEEAGFGDNFQHGMGHGIGLAIHELPSSYSVGRDDVRFKANQVITVEPGIYLPGLGGVRIEDDILLTHGDAQVLTKASTDLQIID